MRRARWVLAIAFALSLLVHVLVALIAHPPRSTLQREAEVVSIEHRPTTIAMTKMPTPPPRPKHTPIPRPSASAPPAPKKTAATGARASGGGSGAATAVPTTAPTPAPTPTGAGCAQPNAAAAVVETPPPPEIAPAVRAAGTRGTALVEVRLDARGDVAAASVAQSTGNTSLDLVAVAMARNARYAPAVRDCKPVASAYTFGVKFVAW